MKGIWSIGANVLVENVTAANCAVTAGVQSNWGSCMGTYAFQHLHVNRLRCLDPFATIPSAGCNARTHYTAIHLNKAFDNDCMPTGAVLSLQNIEYAAADDPVAPFDRPKCGQCQSCCGPCSLVGFDNLTIEYLDASVPKNSCMVVNAGC